MCDSEAEKILFILNKHERAYRRLIPVYIFLAIVLWILPILLIVYLYFCIVDNEFLRIGFCIAWTAYYFLCKRLVRTVLIFTESSDQLSRATDRVPGLPASPGYVQ